MIVDKYAETVWYSIEDGDSIYTVCEQYDYNTDSNEITVEDDEGYPVSQEKREEILNAVDKYTG